MPASYVLEDGTVYRSSDFATGTALSLPPLFGLAAAPGSAMVSNDQAVATYRAVAADLGSLATQVQALNPVGFGAAPTAWTVVMTNQRARIYAFLAEFNAYAPVLWVDKFGHQVTFQWRKSTSGVPAPFTAVYSIKVLSVNPSLSPSQYKGMLVQWPGGGGSGVVDLLRADFINVDAPSVRVQGLQGAGSIPADVDLSGYATESDTVPQLAGPVFRPQTVTIATQNLLTAPAWIGAGQPLPAMVAGTPGQNLTPQVWQIGFDAAHSSVATITEPNGLVSTFSTELGSLGLPITPTQINNYIPGQMDYLGASYAVSTDAPNSLTLTTLGGTATGAVASSASNFDSAGRPLQSTDENGVSTTFSYDTRGRLLSRTATGIPAITYGYPDELTSTTMQAGVTITTTRNRFGQVTTQVAGDGTSTKYAYDAAGRLAGQQAVSTAGVDQVGSTLSYDLLDRVTRQVNPGGAGATTTFAYSVSPRNAAHSRATATLAHGTLNAVTVTDRNALGQLMFTQDPLGVTTTFTYDGFGHATQIVTTDPATGKVQTRSFTYDLQGRLLARTEPETGTTTFGNFDDLNHPTTITETGGRVRTLAFDGLGRCVSQKNLATGDAMTWGFTGTQMTSATNQSGGSTVSENFTYSGPGGQLSEEDITQPGLPTSTITYAYDLSARLSTVSYPSHRVITYGYDGVNRVSNILNNGVSLVSTVSYNTLGQRQRITFNSNAYSDWSTKDGGTHLDKWTLGCTSSGTVADYLPGPRVYLYDTAERLTQAGEWSMGLDAKGRILSAAAPALGLATGTFGHDGFGNNRSSTYTGTGMPTISSFQIDPSLSNRTPAVDTAGAITGWAYAPASNGEAQSVGLALGAGAKQLALAWDGLCHLASVNNGQTGATESYMYSGMGLRVSRSNSLDSTQNARFIYAANGTLLSFIGATGAVTDVVYLGARPIAEIDSAGVHELHVDHLGTPRIVTSGATGNIEGRQSFGAYGETLPGGSAGYAPVTGYTGHLRADSTGLVYMRGRYYAPAWHRFLNSDQGLDPNQLNQMAYAGGSPLTNVDPTGMGALSDIWHWIVNKISDSTDGTSRINDGGGATVEVIGEMPPDEGFAGVPQNQLESQGQPGRGGGRSGGIQNNKPQTGINSAGVWWVNRTLGGSTAKEGFVSHSFTMTTNPNGTLLHTYSWGYDGGHSWSMDDPNDIVAGNQALADLRYPNFVGGSDLIPDIQLAYRALAGTSSEYHNNWFFFSNCKAGVDVLVNTAWQIHSATTP